MKYLLIIIAIAIFIKCKHNLTEVATEELSIKHDEEKKDTLIKKLETVKYDNDLSFGITSLEWNKSMALLAKKGVLKDLHESTDATMAFEDMFVHSEGYIGIYSCENSYSHKIIGHFISNNSDSNKVYKIYVNGEEKNNPVLFSIENRYKFTSDNSAKCLSILNLFLKSNSLKTIDGNPFNINFKLPTEADMHRSSRIAILAIDQNIGEVSPGVYRFNEMSTTNNSVVENNKLYAEIKTNKSNNYDAEIENGTPTHLIKSSYTIELIINSVPKLYTNLGINFFYSDVIQGKIQKEKQKNDLIDKALKH